MVIFDSVKDEIHIVTPVRPKDGVSAKAAYEMIVTAFAQGDRVRLKELLSPLVFDGFNAAITDREKRNEVMSTTFVAIDSAVLVDAHLKDQMIQITVKFSSKLITVTKDAAGQVIEGAAEGNLCIADSWPGQMRTVYGDHQRFIDTYFKTYPGKYFTGDGCRRDEDGYYWITGRVDDVINVAGHRMGTAEVESALVAHSCVSEAAVVGYPHDIKGQGIYAYVTLMSGQQPTEDLRKELVQWVRKEIGPIASPDLIQFAPGLPKTRSGKIMRRILRKIAEDDFGALGDTSTLADPTVVDDLVTNRQNKKGEKAAS